MLIERDMAKLLGSIAFLGMWEGRFAESESIFRALQADSPDRIGPSLGLSLSLIHQGKFDDAVTMLEGTVLPKDANDVHARCWLGLALYMKQDYAKARTFLEAVASESDYPDAVALADDLLSSMIEKGV